MKRTTSTQRAILRWIATSWRENGYGPTVREIGRSFGWDSSAAAAYQHLKRLRAKGLVRWEPNLTRTTRLTAAGRKAIKETDE